MSSTPLRVMGLPTGLAVPFLVSLAAGAALGLAFPPYDAVWLLPPSVAALSLLTHRAGAGRGVVLGTGFGTAFMLVLLPWLRVIGVDAWIALSLLEGLFYGLLGGALAVVSRLRSWPVWTAALWAAVELLRGVLPWGGFPWGRLAFAAAGTPAQGWMGWVGAAGTTFVVALTGSTLAWAVTRLRPPVRRPVHAAGAVLLAVGLAGLPVLLPVGSVLAGPDSATRVAAVQGSVPGRGMDAFAERRAVLDNHVAATLGLAERVDRGDTARPDLVLWPENSTDIDPFRDPTAAADIQRAVDAVGVPVLVGAMVGGPGPGQVRNQGIVWLPEEGPTASYSKRHPVPFGEYIPLRDALARWFRRLDQIPRDMVPGGAPGTLDVAGTRLGDLICFEVGYDDLVRDVVRDDADVLVVQTNNATYMGTGQLDQQFAIARLRAVETGRWVAVVATSGVSGFVDAHGDVVQRAALRDPAVLEQSVPRAEGLTPAVRFGAAVDLALLATAVLASAAGLLAGRRSRRRRPAAEPVPPPAPAQPAGSRP